MKKIFVALNILALLGLLGCQSGKDAVVEKHSQGTGLPVPPAQENHGGIDGGGGGNGVDGKSLEDFRVPLSSLESFDLVRKNVIEKMATRFPELAADLLHIAEERAWYLIPVDLRQLPPTNIGTYFPTDQIAMQSLRSVWISDKIFSKMKIENQSMLILHELMMGVRLLQYTNVLDQCLVKIDLMKLDPQQKDKYRESRLD